MFIASDLHFEGLKYDKIARYLGKVMTRNEILEENVEEILYLKEGKMEEKQKKKKKGKKTLYTKKSGGNILNTISSGGTALMGTNNNVKDVGGKKTLNTKKSGGNILKNVTSEGSSLVATNNHFNGVNKRKKKITKNMKKVKNLQKIKTKKKVILGPKREATKEEKRNMFGKVLEILIVVTTENHVYKFGNEYRVQAKGGPIGLRCTGEMADCCMIDWDKILLKKLKNVGIEPKIYTRFKDDINICTESLEKGSKLVNDKLIIDEEKRAIDEDRSDDMITMEIIREIAETIDPNIKLTIDTPSSYEDGLMPILDLKVGLNPNLS